MPEQLRLLRCMVWACEEPPVYEVLGPVPDFLCERHAEERLEEDMRERWVQLGEETYLKQVMEIVDTLEDLADRSPTFREVCDAAMCYAWPELQRARRAYVEAGGKPEPTRSEIDYAYFEMDFRFGS